MLVDLLLQYLALRKGGFRPLVGRSDALGYWDLLKAGVAAGALFLVARRANTRAMIGFGLLFLVVGLEERLSLHAALAEPLADVLRFESWIPGVRRTGSLHLAELVILASLGLVALGFAWAGRQPELLTLRRARALLTVVLATLFLFAGVVDLANGLRGWNLDIIEEVGERTALSLAVGYSVGLASIREWWLLP